MPELPEVETIVRGLGARLVGRRVQAIWGSGRPLRLARPVDLRAIERIAGGREISRVRRRGKYILIEVERGGILVHLGMSGRLRLQPAGDARAQHTHLVVSLDGGDELRFVDPRRFGWVRAVESFERAEELARLGPDPLTDLDEPSLAAALAESRAPVKAFLLDQRRIAGLGNIYACEALFRAGIHPRAVARRIRRRARDLYAGIRAALEGGIHRRGTTLRDYVDVLGAGGDNLPALLVYARAGERCRRCQALVRRRIDQARSTFYCPRCQRR